MLGFQNKYVNALRVNVALLTILVHEIKYIFGMNNHSDNVPEEHVGNKNVSTLNDCSIKRFSRKVINCTISYSDQS
jgi:hypothetical protein